MATELKGMPVAAALGEKIAGQMEKLGEIGITPKLAVVRVGEREDDISYERGILRRFASANAAVEVVALPRDCPQGVLDETVVRLNDDASVHGILVFSPLPGHLSGDRPKRLIAPNKDVDGMGTICRASVYEGDGGAYAPCTAQAVIELLDFYNIGLAGKKATLIGRSLTVGKPLAMLFLGRNATVTICHTKTPDIAGECRRADILVACAGSAKMVGPEFTNPGQIVIDVGINMLDGRLCGDADYEAISGRVAAITPVPGGVGAVTTSVLLKNTANSAIRASNLI